MSTYTQIIYHIVFSTKNRTPFLADPLRENFYRYTSGIIKNKQGHLYRINGTSDHVHVLTSLHPTTSLSDFVKDIKVASSMWIKDQPLGRGFTGWQDDYGGVGKTVITNPWVCTHGYSCSALPALCF